MRALFAHADAAIPGHRHAKRYTADEKISPMLRRGSMRELMIYVGHTTSIISAGILPRSILDIISIGHAAFFLRAGFSHFIIECHASKLIIGCVKASQLTRPLEISLAWVRK